MSDLPANWIRKILSRSGSSQGFSLAPPYSCHFKNPPSNGYVHAASVHQHLAVVLTEIKSEMGYADAPGNISPDRNVLIIKHNLSYYDREDEPFKTTLPPHATTEIRSLTEEAFNKTSKGVSFKQVMLLIHTRWLEIILPESMLKHAGIKQLIYSNQPYTHISKLTTEQYGLAIQLFDIRDWSKVTPAQSIKISDFCLTLLMICLRQIVDFSTENAQSPEVMRIRLYVESLPLTISKNEAVPSINAAARLCLMSPAKFQRMFKKHTGSSYGAYCIYLKMKYARSLMDKQEITFCEAMKKTGYINMSFARKKYRSFLSPNKAKRPD